MIHRHSSPGEGLAPYRIQPVWLNGTTLRHVIPSGVEESTQVADFTLRWYFLLRGGFLHSACAQGLNDRRFWFGCCGYERTTIPALRPDGGRLPPLQWGVPCFGWYHSTAQVIRPTWRAAGCRPYDTFVINTVYFTCLMSIFRSKNVKNDVRCRPYGNVLCFRILRLQIGN